MNAPRSCPKSSLSSSDSDSAAQLTARNGRADRRLCVLTQNSFAQRAAEYGIGESARADRPHGYAAVVLADAFVAELIGAPDDTESEDEDDPGD